MKLINSGVQTQTIFPFSSELSLIRWTIANCTNCRRSYENLGANGESKCPIIGYIVERGIYHSYSKKMVEKMGGVESPNQPNGWDIYKNKCTEQEAFKPGRGINNEN